MTPNCALEVDRQDVLTRWAADYFLAAQDKGLSTMLEAALERRYSASTGEGFFTGGGLHHFDNFNREDDGKVMSVRDGLRNSVNLVFIRLMRDIVHHYMFLTPARRPSCCRMPAIRAAPPIWRVSPIARAGLHTALPGQIPGQNCARGARVAAG